MEKCLQDYLHGVGTLDCVRTPRDFDALCEAVQADEAGRLRWRILRQLGLSPLPSAPGRDDYLYACAQLFADRNETLDRLCPKCRAQAQREACPMCGGELPTVNPAFDAERYEELMQNDTAL